MPQLDLLTFVPTAFYVLVGFLTVVYMAWRSLLPKLSLMLKFRDKILSQSDKLQVLGQEDSLVHRKKAVARLAKLRVFLSHFR